MYCERRRGRSAFSLIEVMGQTSNEAALPVLRATMKGSDPEFARAAILALTAWENPAPLMDLLGLAKSFIRNIAPGIPAEQADYLFGKN